MNGKLNVAWAFCVAMMLCPPAHAWDVVNGLTTPLEDPLLTRPPVLDTGKILPGDTAPISCPEVQVEGGPLTLADAVNVALCRNPQVRGAWAAIKVQAAAVGEARAAYLPTLSLNASPTKDRTWYPGASQAYPETTVKAVGVYASLNWRLFDFGGRQADRHAANDLLDAALANHDAALQKALTDVIQAYFDAQTARAAWTAQQEDEVLARRTLEATQHRERRGVNSQGDTLQATTALAKVSLEKGRAQGAYEKAISVLVYALGMPATTQLSLADNDLVDGTASIREDLTDWLTQAQARHPAIVAAQAQLAAAEEKVTSTRAEGLPTVDLMANFYQNGRPNQGLPTVRTRETLVGLTLTIPLFDGFSRTYKVRGAQAQAEQKEADLEDTQRQVLMDVVKAHADAVASLDNLDASQRLLSAAQASLATMQRQYDKGAADVLQILTAQTTLSDAQQERIRCLADWRSARLRLLAAAGGLGLQDAR